MLSFQLLISVLIVFAVNHTEPAEKTCTGALQNLGCHIEIPFIVESFVIGKPCSFQQIHVRSRELLNYATAPLSPPFP